MAVWREARVDRERRHRARLQGRPALPRQGVGDLQRRGAVPADRARDQLAPRRRARDHRPLATPSPAAAQPRRDRRRRRAVRRSSGPAVVAALQRPFAELASPGRELDAQFNLALGLAARSRSWRRRMHLPRRARAFGVAGARRRAAARRSMRRRILARSGSTRTRPERMGARRLLRAECDRGGGRRER